MPSQRDTNITSYFQPTGEDKEKRKTMTESSKLSNSDASAKDITSNPQTMDKGKRPMSGSPPVPAKKRPNIKDTTMDAQKHLAYNDLPAEWNSNLCTVPKGSQDAKPKTLQLTYHQGDIFEAPQNCLLIHACNTQGHWGAGIAKGFKERYPKAHAAHAKFCAKEHNKTNPVPTGTAQLLAPVDGEPQHWIGCVFTSAKYGKAKDKPDQIIRNTVASMKMLLELVKVAEEGEDGVSTVRMCKINSGKFGIPWERTEEVLKNIVLQEGWRSSIEVWEP